MLNTHRIITKNDVESAILYLTEFYKKVVEVYGNEHVTPNMHMHLHLKDRCLDYRSVYGFWCFAYEHYNGILGAYQTNKKFIESQLMKQFLSLQIINSLKIHLDFKEFDELLHINNQEKGSLKITNNTSIHTTLNFIYWQNHLLNPCNLINTNYFMQLKMMKTLGFCLQYMKRFLMITLLKSLYPTYDIEHFSLFSLQSNSAVLLSQVFNSKHSRNTRNSVYIASWPTDTGSINCFMRACQINYFLRHNISTKHKISGKILKSSHILCYVSWFKRHVKQE